MHPQAKKPSLKDKHQAQAQLNVVPKPRKAGRPSGKTSKKTPKQ
jgi:hypothetical protein